METGIRQLTEEEILEKLKTSGVSINEYAFESYIPPELGLGEIVEVTQHGGEGEGDNWYTVKLFKDHNIYIKTSGFYSSYNGADFNCGWGKEVKPMEKVVTMYE